METRLYFLLGDLLACVLVAVVAACACAAIFSDAWPMVLLMPVSMVVGMFIGLLVAVLAGLIYFFGAMEIMVPTMFTGMVAGMWGAMVGAGPEFSYASLAMQGATLGLVVNVAIRIYSMSLSGIKHY